MIHCRFSREIYTVEFHNRTISRWYENLQVSYNPELWNSTPTEQFQYFLYNFVRYHNFVIPETVFQ
jgi:hypothetical protein